MRRLLALYLVVPLVTTASIHAQSAASAQPSQQHTAAPSSHVFASDAGLVLNFIKPDKTSDFEAVMERLRTALKKSDKPERRQQAASWRVFRAVEPAANGAVLYVFVIDPAVKGADYTVSTILAEAFPDDVQALYTQYAGAYSTGQNFVNLTLIQALGQDADSVK
jgi:23S rRNA G2069 N7-methylase RlmK/C1962 C5-methylase RlmI